MMDPVDFISWFWVCFIIIVAAFAALSDWIYKNFGGGK